MPRTCPDANAPSRQACGVGQIPQPLRGRRHPDGIGAGHATAVLQPPRGGGGTVEDVELVTVERPHRGAEPGVEAVPQREHLDQLRSGDAVGIVELPDRFGQQPHRHTGNVQVFESHRTQTSQCFQRFRRSFRLGVHNEIVSVTDGWKPLTVERTVAVFEDAEFEWWISGGYALELHTGRSWRSHADMDVGVRRVDLPKLARLLIDWDLFVASDGGVRRWRGDDLASERGENNIWSRPPASNAWALDITVADGNEQWQYRRRREITLPWRDAILFDATNVPYVAPEIQMLFKSRDRRPKDDVDAAEVIPALDTRRAERLRGWLPSDHPWQQLLVAR
jgi:hypothetical protein